MYESGVKREDWAGIIHYGGKVFKSLSLSLDKITKGENVGREEEAGQGLFMDTLTVRLDQ